MIRMRLNSSHRLDRLSWSDPGLTLTLPAAIAATATGTASTTAASRSLTRVRPNNTHESATDQHSRECDRTTLTRVRLQPFLDSTCRTQSGKAPVSIRAVLLTTKQLTKLQNICDLRQSATCNLPSGIPNEFPSARIIFALVQTTLPPRSHKLSITHNLSP